MIRTLLSGIMLFAVCSPGLAQQAEAVATSQLSDSNIFHWIITVFGTLWAARLASRAFNRPSVPLADVPTFPMYMTSRIQYQLGSLIFIIFACSFFLALVRLHREVVGILDLLPLPVTISKQMLQAIREQSASYLAVVSAMGVLYLYLLTKETEWNLLLMIRDTIQRWISIPQLAGRIVAQIRFSLSVPKEAVANVIASSRGVGEQDFRKDSKTPDRIWAETCYMRWWLTEGHSSGEDASFFSEESFGFVKFLEEFQRTSSEMERWKHGGARVDLTIAELPQKIKDLHSRIARLVACYLVYRNGSKKELYRAAGNFGIDLIDRVPENPLRYWIVYAVVLVASVYIGVYASAIAYDLFTGKGLSFVQDQNRTLAWIMYTLCNYGLAIFLILLLRLMGRSLQIDLNQSHLITYCWTFLVAFVAGPFGLTLAVHFFGEGKFPETPLDQLYFHMLRWGLGPALVSVYISYYLDRQTCHDLPVVDHSSATFVWRLMNCFGFAAVNVFLLLPQLLSIVAQPNARWDTAKLQFVAAGCVLYVALGLALAAQFALRKGTQPDPVADLSLRFGASPDRSLAQWVEDGSLPLGRVSSAAPASHVPGLAAGTRKPSTPKPRQANATRGGAYLGRPSQRTPPREPAAGAERGLSEGAVGFAAIKRD
jgi:hypothetical protein